MSYSEIQSKLNVPKSTLSFWLKKIKLTEEQEKKLNEDRLEALKRGLEKKISRTRKIIEEIKITSAKNIKNVSKKELWLMGVILYWRERLLSGNDNDLRKGVKFTTSDPYLAKLFLKWLKDIGRIKNEEIGFDIFMSVSDKASTGEAIAFWSDVTEFPEDKFKNIYFQKTRPKRKKGGRATNRTKFGLLRTRVKASSMLARQIAGWVRGIIRYYWE